MPNRDYNYRRHKRYVKGIKRIRIDRAEHGNPQNGEHRYWGSTVGGPICECFCEAATHGKGAIFAKFADRPRSCSCWYCTNVDDHFHFAPTLKTEEADEG